MNSLDGWISASESRISSRSLSVDDSSSCLAKGIFSDEINPAARQCLRLKALQLDGHNVQGDENQVL
jgi:hypothetical protein